MTDTGNANENNILIKENAVDPGNQDIYLRGAACHLSRFLQSEKDLLERRGKGGPGRSSCVGKDTGMDHE